MKKTVKKILISILLAFNLTQSVHAGFNEVGTQFTYQGELLDNGSPADGVYDLLIQLFPSATGGITIENLGFNDVEVTNGLFNVELDYGDMPFSGEEMFLQVNVRPGDSTSTYETLLPRQRINATPYAIQAEFAENGESPWQENGNGLSFGNDVIIGNAGTTTSSLLTVDSAASESPLRVKIAGATRLIVRDNGGTSIGVNTSAPENGLRVEGDVRQPLDKHGFAKAGITFVCGNQSTNITSQFNNQNSDAIIVTSNVPEDGRCEIVVPFDITDSYFSVTTNASNFPRGVACGKTTNGSGDDIIVCNAWNPLTGVRSDAIVSLLLF